MNEKLLNLYNQVKQITSVRPIEEIENNISYSQSFRWISIINNDQFEVRYIPEINKCSLMTPYNNQEEITDEWINTATALKDYINEFNN